MLCVLFSLSVPVDLRSLSLSECVPVPEHGCVCDLCFVLPLSVPVDLRFAAHLVSYACKRTSQGLTPCVCVVCCL